jgi:hypothetical protein
MDYAFVPGVTCYEKLLKRAMKSRKNTTLIDKAGIATIADFLQSLATNSQQADNLVMGAHANDEAFAIPFDSTTKVPPGSDGRDYEMVQAVNIAGTIHIPAAVSTSTTNCYIKGCNVGADSAQPFLQLFKKALSNPQQVNGPKFFHDLKDDSGNGVLEYMLVEYTVMSPTPFSKTADLVAEFRKQNFLQGVEVGGTQAPVPDKWSDWIRPTLQLSPSTSDEKPFDILTRIVPAAGGLRFINLKNGRCTSRREGLNATQPMGTQTIPPDKPGKMKFLKPLLQGDPRETSGLPLHARFGFSSLDEWIAGFDWTPIADETDAANRKIIFIGNHFVYGVRLPIMATGTNHLIYNYYPTHGTPRMNFLEDNAKFVMFGTA